MKQSRNKSHTVCIILFAAAHLLAHGQTSTALQTGTNPRWKAFRKAANPAGDVLTAAAPTKWVVAQSGPHSRTWVPASDGSTPAGGARKAQQYVALASGMNFWDGSQWTPSVPEFRPSEDAFEATRVQHAVRLNLDIYAPGSVALKVPQSPTGDILSSTPVGIGLLDPVSGQFYLIATLTNSAGVLVESNCVLYPDAFAGDGICASIEYRIAAGSFSQNVIFTGRFDPADWGFSTNCRVQIITELFSPPAPEITRQPIYVESDPTIRSRSVTPDLVDEVIRFGELMLPTGHAFLTSDTAQEGSRPAIIAKEFRTVGSRTFLVESVAFTAISSKVQALPICATPPQHARVIQKDAKSGYASIPTPAARKMAASPAKAPSTRLAKSAARPSGLLLDYVVTIGPGYTTPAVFQSDTTYVLTGRFIAEALSIEAAVFKYPNSTGNSPTTAYLQISGTLTSKTSAYFPAIFTAADDDSVGQVVSHTTVAGPSGTVTPGVYYANPAIQMYYVSGSLSNLRFRYCQSGVSLYGTAGTSLTVSHSQFLNCLRGINLYGGCGGCGCGSTISVSANNNLMSGVQYPVYVNSGPSYSLSLYQCTIDGGSTPAPYLAYSAGPSTTCTFWNSVLANIQALGSPQASVGGNNNGFWHCPSFGSTYFTYTAANGPSPFQTGDSGKHYLTNNSGFQARGSPSIPSTLLADLKTRSTQAALWLPPEMYLTGGLSLGPRALRYVSGAPDLGYYYPVLDYSIGGMILDGATVTVLPGTAIGLRCDYFTGLLGPITHWAFFVGFDLLPGSMLTSEAKPENPAVFAAISLVQEMPPTMPYWPYVNSLTAFTRNYNQEGFPDNAPTLDFRFCNLCVMQNDYHMWTANGDIEAVNFSLR